MKVLIVGAGGPLGQALVFQALKQHHEVTALVRSPKQTVGAGDAHLKVVEGDVTRTGNLDAPMAAQEAVICSLGVKPTRMRVSVLSEGTGNVIRAMQRHNVRRLLCITGIGAGDSRGHGGLLYDRFIQPLVLKTIYEDKDRQEKVVEQSDRDWILIRPARLTDSDVASRFSVVQRMQGLRATSISRKNVAKWTVEQLKIDKYLYRTVVLTE